MLPKLMKKLLLGALFFSGVSLFSNAAGIAATLSEIPNSAVTLSYEEPPISTSPRLILGFQISVADIPELDPNLRLTSFTAALDDPTIPGLEPDSFRLWAGVPAPGWQGSGTLEGYRFEALSPENGIAPGSTLSGFAARDSWASTSAFSRSILKVTSVSSTAVPEPSSGLLSTLALGAFLGTGVVFKRKLKARITTASITGLSVNPGSVLASDRKGRCPALKLALIKNRSTQHQKFVLPPSLYRPILISVLVGFQACRAAKTSPD